MDVNANSSPPSREDTIRRLRWMSEKLKLQIDDLENMKCPAKLHEEKLKEIKGRFKAAMDRFSQSDQQEDKDEMMEWFAEEKRLNDNHGENGQRAQAAFDNDFNLAVANTVREHIDTVSEMKDYLLNNLTAETEGDLGGLNHFQDEDLTMATGTVAQKEDEDGREPTVLPEPHQSNELPSGGKRKAAQEVDPSDRKKQRGKEPPVVAESLSTAQEQEGGKPADGTEETRNKETITFDEVFRDGKAEMKHTIIGWPEYRVPEDWYILTCPPCGAHALPKTFKTRPFGGASKHFRGLHRERLDHTETIERIGIRVLGCNAEIAKKNNEVAAKYWKDLEEKQKEKAQKRKVKKHIAMQNQFGTGNSANHPVEVSEDEEGSNNEDVTDEDNEEHPPGEASTSKDAGREELQESGKERSSGVPESGGRKEADTSTEDKRDGSKDGGNTGEKGNQLSPKARGKQPLCRSTTAHDKETRRTNEDQNRTPLTPISQRKAPSPKTPRSGSASISRNRGVLNTPSDDNRYITSWLSPTSTRSVNKAKDQATNEAGLRTRGMGTDPKTPPLKSPRPNGTPSTVFRRPIARAERSTPKKGTPSNSRVQGIVPGRKKEPLLSTSKDKNAAASSSAQDSPQQTRALSEFHTSLFMTQVEQDFRSDDEDEPEKVIVAATDELSKNKEQQVRGELRGPALMAPMEAANSANALMPDTEQEAVGDHSPSVRKNKKRTTSQATANNTLLRIIRDASAVSRANELLRHMGVSKGVGASPGGRRQSDVLSQ